jgi:tetratricopeptide (TPR) repeat protein
MLYAELFAAHEAQCQFEAAMTLARELHSPTWSQALLGALGGVYLLLEDQVSAQVCLETAITPRTSMDTIGKRYCWVRKAELALAQEQPALELDITERLIASAPGMSPGRVITYLWKLKGEALAAAGREEDAFSLLHTALENARITGERFLLWRIHTYLGQLYYSIGAQQAGKKEIESAHTVINDLTVSIPDQALKAKFLQGVGRILDTPL